MPEDIRKHLKASCLDMVQMMRSGPEDQREANLDTWKAVYGVVSLPILFNATELDGLVKPGPKWRPGASRTGIH